MRSGCSALFAHPGGLLWLLLGCSLGVHLLVSPRLAIFSIGECQGP